MFQTPVQVANQNHGVVERPWAGKVACKFMFGIDVKDIVQHAFQRIGECFQPKGLDSRFSQLHYFQVIF